MKKNIEQLDKMKKIKSEENLDNHGLMQIKTEEEKPVE